MIQCLTEFFQVVYYFVCFIFRLFHNGVNIQVELRPATSTNPWQKWLNPNKQTIFRGSKEECLCFSYIAHQWWTSSSKWIPCPPSPHELSHFYPGENLQYVVYGLLRLLRSYLTLVHIVVYFQNSSSPSSPLYSRWLGKESVGGGRWMEAEMSPSHLLKCQNSGIWLYIWSMWD